MPERTDLAAIVWDEGHFDPYLRAGDICQLGMMLPLQPMTDERARVKRGRFAAGFRPAYDGCVNYVHVFNQARDPLVLWSVELIGQRVTKAVHLLMIIVSAVKE